MQVTFKLTAAQLATATTIIARYVREEEERNAILEASGWGRSVTSESMIDLGNLLPVVQADLPTCFNFNQNLELNQDAMTIHYKGERYPLAQDGGLRVLKEIADGDISTLRVVGYETSDKRLQWFETLEDYILQRSTQEEFLEYYKNKSLVPTIGSGWLWKIVETRFPALAACMAAIDRGQNERMLAASFDAKTVKDAKSFFRK